jgi:hypothetical protein
MVRVRVNGVRYWYQPVIFTNREPALAAGREIWGFAKKLADMDLAGGIRTDHFYHRSAEGQEDRNVHNDARPDRQRR